VHDRSANANILNELVTVKHKHTLRTPNSFPPVKFIYITAIH